MTWELSPNSVRIQPFALNQYTSTPMSSTLIYDGNGNLLEDDAYSYRYNARDQLTAVEPKTPSSDNYKVVNTYDYLGRRARKEVRAYAGTDWSSDSIRALSASFVYDGWNLVAELDSGREKYRVNPLPLSWPFRASRSGLLASETIEYGYDFSGLPARLQGAANSFQFDSSGVYKVSLDYADRNRLASVTPEHQNQAGLTGFGYQYIGHSGLVDKLMRDFSSGNDYIRDYDYETDSYRISRLQTTWGRENENGDYVPIANTIDVQPVYDGLGRLQAQRIKGAVANSSLDSSYGSVGLHETYAYDDRNQVTSAQKRQLTSNWGSTGAAFAQEIHTYEEK